MRLIGFIALLLIIGSLLSGCIEREASVPSTTASPQITEAPAPQAEDFPDVTATAEPVIEIEEPSFELNETVDLGSIL